MSAPSLAAPVHNEDTALPTGAHNISCVLHGIDDVRFEDRPVPTECGEDDAIVSPAKISVCGSDTHYIKHGRIGDFIVEKPMVLGHETAAVVVQVGSRVTNIKAGDRVALEPGTLAAYYTLPADLCYPLPSNMSLEEGALLEPMSVGVHAVHKVAQMKSAANVVVFGAGPVGLLTCAVAKGLGARKVIAVDIQEARLAFAKEQGLVDDYYLPPKPQDGEAKADYPRRNAKELCERFGFEERGPRGVDLVLDCSGAEVCIQTGVFVLKHGGTLVQVGMGKPDITLDMHTIITRELTLKGSFRYGPGVYELAMDLVARGAVNLKSLISHRYAFRDALKAFEANHTGIAEDGRPLIKAVIDGPRVDEKLE
ncbi:xylitol dehydrogenase [Rhodotorula graminis WP1]|uniref:Xylitol dehydrogenase n=1 Tax=Rhodotorula graminis (strain WP1) TaxID=578459 RepID=A0A194S165_RHOGW|nr:xylitol dehydrogenase [Rhodotorula graminis WP1]KPV74463.1 xylitol dehydrogenase [Rhodotorula graminis WP1]